VKNALYYSKITVLKYKVNFENIDQFFKTIYGCFDSKPIQRHNWAYLVKNWIKKKYLKMTIGGFEPTSFQ
jgi:hypothetical protein